MSASQAVVTYPIPIGSVFVWAGKAVLPAPTAHLICDGSAISRSIYWELFDTIGTLYGSGDGTTTFNIPNMVGQFAIGGETAGLVVPASGGSGTTSFTLQESDIPPHTWTYNSSSFSASTTWNQESKSVTAKPLSLIGALNVLNADTPTNQSFTASYAGGSLTYNGDNTPISGTYSLSAVNPASRNFRYIIRAWGNLFSLTPPPRVSITPSFPPPQPTPTQPYADIPYLAGLSLPQ
jgi:microcystin-dependent protein